MLSIDPGARWRLQEHLLALMADSLAVANWQRSGDEKIPKPQPLPRPGVNEPAPPIPDLHGRLRALKAKNQRRG